jgi:hypothetical protein
MNPKKPSNPNAFPTMEHGYDRTGSPTVSTYEGMTLRDYFAAKALQGHLASEYYIMGNKQEGKESLAKDFYNFADAMLKAREL